MDNLPHYLLLCPKTFAFWKTLFNWWNKNNITQVDIQRDDILENVIFGFMNNNTEHSVLNYVCLYAKYYIYTRKQDVIYKIDFYDFLPKLSFSLYKELHILCIPKKLAGIMVKLKEIYEIINPIH